MANSAELATLTGSLMDRSAARARVDRALVPSVPVEVEWAETPLFCAKGQASVSPLDVPARQSVKRPRLWLRLQAAERRRIHVAAASMGQSTAAFLRDALAAFTDNLVPPPAAPHHHARCAPSPLKDRPVKLAFRVDATVHAEAHRAAQRRGQSVQALLITAIAVHLARLIDDPAATNLRSLLEAFDIIAAERAVEDRGTAPGAEVIDFPVRQRVSAPATPAPRHAAR